jgi:signal peptidase II
MREKRLRLLIPFSLTAAVILLDQILKALIVRTIAEGSVGLRIFGNVIRIIHTRNDAIAFSIGRNLPETVKDILFVLIPVLVVAVLFVYYFRSKTLSALQRWMLSGIAGGGIGNLLDRIFRENGVVDFIDIKFYGILGLERWPAFNIADASVVVCGIVLIVSMLIDELKTSKQKSEDNSTQSGTSGNTMNNRRKEFSDE